MAGARDGAARPPLGPGNPPLPLVAVRLDITDLIEQREALEAAQQQAQQARQLLQDAVEALPECFALFDADDRLVICNAQYRRLYPISAPMMVAGSTPAPL